MSNDINRVEYKAALNFQINSLLGRFDKKRKRRKLNTALTAESAEFLLNKPSAIQSESKKLGEEIQALLNHKSAREKTIIENLKSNKTAQVILTHLIVHEIIIRIVLNYNGMMFKFLKYNCRL